MVLATSAILAILLAEPEAAPMLRSLARDDVRLVEMTRAAATLARSAWTTYGVSMARGEPLLVQGGDFGHTDVEAVSDEAPGPP